MPKINLEYFQPQTLGPSGVRADTGMFQAQGAAAARLGNAVQGIGEQLVGFALKKQEAVNYGKMAEAERQLHEGWALFQDDMDKEPDESKWDAMWQKRSAEIEKGLKFQDLAPVVKERLGVTLAGWKKTTSLAVTQATTKRQIGRAAENVLGAADGALKMGDVEGFSSLVRGGVANGLIDPVDGERMVREGAGRAEHYNAMGQIMNDPVTALEMLEDKTDGGRWRNWSRITPDDREGLIAHATQKVNALRTEAFNDMVERTMNGNPLTRDELLQKVEAKLITPKQAKEYQRAYLNGKTGGAEKAADIMGRITAFDPRGANADADYLALVGDVATMGLPTAMQAEALALLKEKRSPESAFNSPAARGAFATVDGFFKKGMFGAFEEQKITAMGTQTVVNPKAYQRAVAIRADVEDKLRDFIKKNPTATEVELTNYLMTVTEKHTNEAALAAISVNRIGSKPGVNLSAEDAAKEKAAKLEAILKKLSQ